LYLLQNHPLQNNGSKVKGFAAEERKGLQWTAAQLQLQQQLEPLLERRSCRSDYLRLRKRWSRESERVREQVDKHPLCQDCGAFHVKRCSNNVVFGAILLAQLSCLEYKRYLAASVLKSLDLFTLVHSRYPRVDKSLSTYIEQLPRHDIKGHHDAAHTRLLIPFFAWYFC
jgi:hypothetical protein